MWSSGVHTRRGRLETRPCVVAWCEEGGWPWWWSPPPSTDPRLEPEPSPRAVASAVPVASRSLVLGSPVVPASSANSRGDRVCGGAGGARAGGVSGGGARGEVGNDDGVARRRERRRDSRSRRRREVRRLPRSRKRTESRAVGERNAPRPASGPSLPRPRASWRPRRRERFGTRRRRDSPTRRADRSPAPPPARPRAGPPSPAPARRRGEKRPERARAPSVAKRLRNGFPAIAPARRTRTLLARTDALSRAFPERGVFVTPDRRAPRLCASASARPDARVRRGDAREFFFSPPRARRRGASKYANETLSRGISRSTR